jgi:hypothetical protein
MKGKQRMTSLERKKKSEELLLSLGITLSDDLPLIEEENTVTLRSAREVAERILILSYLNSAASDPSLRQQMMMFLIQEGLWDKTSAEEKALFHITPLAEEQLTGMLWRTESIWLLLWVIRKIDLLNLPEKEATPHDIFPHLPGFLEPTEDFIRTATMRNVAEILDQSDFIFRLNWALHERSKQGQNTLPMHPHVAYERYFAINWVTRTRETWDDSV